MTYVARNAERHLEQWNRPDPVFPGFTRAYSITIPRTELRFTTQDLTDVRWAPDPGHGYWVRVEVILMDGAGAGTEVAFEDGFILGTLRLHDGGEVVVVAQRFRPDREVAQKLAAYRDLVIAEHPPDAIASADFPVVALYGHQEDGARTMTELALSTPPPSVRVICTRRPATQAPARLEIRWRNPNLYVGGRVHESG